MNRAYAWARRSLRYTTYAHVAPVLWNTFQKNSDVQNIASPPKAALWPQYTNRPASPSTRAGPRRAAQRLPR